MRVAFQNQKQVPISRYSKQSDGRHPRLGNSRQQEGDYKKNNRRKQSVPQETATQALGFLKSTIVPRNEQTWQLVHREWSTERELRRVVEERQSLYHSSEDEAMSSV